MPGINAASAWRCARRLKPGTSRFLLSLPNQVKWPRSDASAFEAVVSASIAPHRDSD